MWGNIHCTSTIINAIGNNSSGTNDRRFSEIGSLNSMSNPCDRLINVASSDWRRLVYDRLSSNSNRFRDQDLLNVLNLLDWLFDELNVLNLHLLNWLLNDMNLLDLHLLNWLLHNTNLLDLYLLDLSNNWLFNNFNRLCLNYFGLTLDIDSFSFDDNRFGDKSLRFDDCLHRFELSDGSCSCHRRCWR